MTFLVGAGAVVAGGAVVEVENVVVVEVGDAVVEVDGLCPVVVVVPSTPLVPYDSNTNVTGTTRINTITAANVRFMTRFCQRDAAVHT